MYIINIKFNRNHSGGGTRIAQSVYDYDIGRTIKEFRFDSWQSLKISFFSTASKMALDPTHLLMQWIRRPFLWR
jgi:hypothetical protein